LNREDSDVNVTIEYKGRRTKETISKVQAKGKTLNASIAL
jgi:hypothetical protein